MAADLYGQEPEARLLAALISHLERRSVIDVGAERGGFALELLQAGADEIHLIEPEPDNVAHLRARFAGDARVAVHECAASDADGTLRLHRSRTTSGDPLSFGHTVLDLPDTADIAWPDTVEVAARSLDSLAADREIPPAVGIVKIDTEGHDLAVVRGMASLTADVVMVEHWEELPHSLGQCPWSAEAITASLRDRGFGHFVFVVHHGETVAAQWDDARVSPGAMGNLVFLHDRVLARVLPDVVACISRISVGAAGLAEARAAAAEERLAVIENLRHELALQSATAAQRLAALEQLKAEYEQVATAASERQRTLDELVSQCDALTETAAERLAALEEVASARDALETTAQDLRAMVEELERERDLQARVATERLEALEALEAESTVRLRALEELAAQRHRAGL